MFEPNMVQKLRDLVSPGVYSCYLGVITAVDGHTAQVELMPSREDIEARIIYPGAVEGRGVYCQPEVDDEVLVLVPSDELFLALCLVGPHSPAAPLPDIGPGVTVLHPEGTRVSKTAGAQRQQVILAPLPADLKTAVDSAVQALQIALPAIQGAVAPPVASTEPAAAAMGLLIVTLLTSVLTALVTLKAHLSVPEAYLSQSLEAE